MAFVRLLPEAVMLGILNPQAALALACGLLCSAAPRPYGR